MINDTNLIGILGKKSHGKNTIADIIRFIEFNTYNIPINESALDDFRTQLQIFYDQEWGNSTGWQIKPFAAALKQIVSLITGCSVSDLEDELYKETPLGEEWWRYEETIGTSTTIHPYLGTSSSLPLRMLTPRMILQLFGTDGGRKIVHPNIWINTTFATFDASSKWIIPDVRFENECAEIKRRGGKLIRVYNPRIHNIDEHESENELNNYENVDVTIINDGSISELIEKVHSLFV